MAAGDLSLNILIGASMAGSFGSTVGAVTSALQSLASGNVMGAVAAGAAAIGAAMVGATKSAGDYEQSLTQLVTGANESASNLKQVGDGILNISTQTGTSVKGLTDAMFLIESSGQHGAAGLQTLTTAAEGAKAGNADLMDTANNLTTILTDYHIPATQATSAMNAFITAVSDGKPPMQAWGTSLGNVLPLASSLGVSFPQVAGAISMMTNAGMTAQRASMDLANALRSLAAPGGAAQKAMAAVGISAQQLKDTLTTQGLSGALQLIEDHISKKFPAGSVQAVEAFKAIMGGATGYNVALMLGGQNMSAYEGDIKNITAAMDAGGNSVIGWSLVQQDFNQKVAQAQAALQAFMIILGEKLLPLLGPIVDGFTSIVSGITNFITGATQASDASNGFQQMLGLVGVGFSYLKDIIGTVADIIGHLFGDAVTLANGILGDFVKSTITDAVAGFNGFLFAVRAVVDQVDAFVQSLTDDLEPIIQIIKPVFDDLASSASTWGNNLMVSFGNGIIDAANAVLNAVEQIAQDIADYLGFASPTKKGPGSTLGKWGIGMVSGLAQGIIAAGPAITNAVLLVASQLQTASTSGGILHTAVTSMIDPISGDAMAATATPDPAISHPSTGLNTTAVKSAASASSHSAAVTTSSAVVTAVKSSATTISSTVSTTAASAKAQKAATSAAAAAQRKAAAAQRAAHTAAMQKAHQQAAAQRAAHTAAMQKAHAAAAAQRQHAAQQRAAHTAAMQKAHQQAAQQRQAAAAQRAQQHAQAQAKREQIHQALLQQHARTQAAKAAAKAGPPAVAGALPNLSNITKPITDIETAAKKAGDAIKQVGANARLMALNISNSFTGIPAAIQHIQELFRQIGQTATQAWNQMKPGLESIGKTIQTQLLPALQTLYTSILQPILGMMGNLVGGFVKWAGEMGKLASESGAFKSTWDTIVQVFNVVISIVSTVVKELSLALSPLFQQIAATVTTQLAPALGNLMKSMVPLIPAVQTLGKILGGILLIALGLVLSAIVGIVAGLAKFLAGAIQTFGGVVQIVSGALQFINGLLTMFVGVLEEVFGGGTSKKVQEGQQAMWQGIKDIWNGAGNVLMGIWNAIVGGIVAAVGGFIGTIIQYFQGLYDALIGHSIIPDIINGLMDWFKKIIDFLPNIVSQFITGVQQWWTDVSTAVTKGAQQAWVAIQTIFNDAWNTYIIQPLTTFMVSAIQWWTGVKAAFTKATQEIWAAVRVIFDSIWTVYVQIPLNNFIAQWNKWWASLKTLATKLTQDVWAAVQTIFNGTWQTQLLPAMTKIGQDFSTWFTQQATSFGTWATNLVKMFAQNFLKAATQYIAPAVNSVATTIKNFLGIQSPSKQGPLSTSDTWFSNLMKMFATQITAGTPKVTSATNQMTTQVQNSVNQMSQKVQQSVQEMMQKIWDVGQTLQQMQSQVSSAVGTMRSDVQTALSDASMAITNMENTVSNSVTNMNEQIATVSQSISQMQQAVNQAINQAAQQVQNAVKSMTASLKAVDSQITATKSNATTQENVIVGGWDKTVQSMNSSAKDISNAISDVASYVAGLEKQSEAKVAQDQVLLQQAKQDKSLVDQITAQIQLDADRAAQWLQQVTVQAAQAAATFMGHSEPSQGPLAGDSQWGVHFMENFITGMQSQIPALANVSQAVATQIVENLLPNTKAMATDVQAALANAATATGDTITALKQKGDDITATIRQLSGLAETPGSQGTYAITTTNVAGDIPVSYQLTPPTPGTAGSQTTQNMTVHIDLDGKSLGKWVGTYMNKELHVQGGVRRV